MILTEEQDKIITAPEEKIIVMSSAGGSKTTVLIEKVRWALKQGFNPREMVVFTFTVNAAQEMKDRLGSDYKDGLFVGTIHGYANFLLMSNGYDTRHVLETENFEELFKLVAERGVVEPIEYLFNDETQDNTFSIHEFIFEVLRPKRFFLVGDPKQSIYDFDKKNPARSDLMMRLSEQYDVKTYYLTENWRNKLDILLYGEGVARQLKEGHFDVTAKRVEPGKVARIEEKSAIMRIITTPEDKYGDWAILCRTNARVEYFLTVLEKSKIPTTTFKQGKEELSDITEKINSNAVKVLTIHAAKGLAFNKVIVADQIWKTQSDIRLMYVACTRARDELYLVSPKLRRRY